MFVPFGEWLPDLPANGTEGAREAKNVVAAVSSYRPLRALSSFTDALTEACLGSFWARSSGNTIFNFAGDASRLYRLQSDLTWLDVSRTVGGTYSATRWEFVQFGDRIIAVNKADATQRFNMGSSTNFEALAGSPPQAAHIAVVRDQVFLGDIDEGGSQPSTVAFSGVNNSEAWEPSAVTQAGRQQLLGNGGAIQRIVGGEVGTIFQQRAIVRATYIQPPLIYRFDEVERGRGTDAPDSVAVLGSVAFFYGTDGFKALNLYGGENSQPIGANRIDRWFKENSASSERPTMRAAVDRENQLVLWAFKNSGSSVTNDRLLIYNYVANRWSYAEVDIQALAEFAQVGLTLDQLDSVLPNGIDIDSINVDSTAFQGGGVNILAFDSSNRGATFSGATLDGCLETAEFSLEDRISLMRAVRPIIEATESNPIEVCAIGRDRIVDSPVASAPEIIDEIGQARFRSKARYHRVAVKTTGNYSHASGVELELTPRGRRTG